MISYIINVITIKTLEALSWEGHCKNPFRYVCNIKVILLILESVPLPTHNLTKPIHFIDNL